MSRYFSLQIRVVANGEIETPKRSAQLSVTGISAASRRSLRASMALPEKNPLQTLAAHSTACAPNLRRWRAERPDSCSNLGLVDVDGRHGLSVRFLRERRTAPARLPIRGKLNHTDHNGHGSLP